MTQIAQRARTVDRDEARVDARLRAVTRELQTRGVGHHHAFGDMVDHLADLVLGGKRLRSLLVMSAWRTMSDSDLNLGPALDVACAFELLHNALLAHDDVIDNDDRRRGQPNVAGRATADVVDRGATAGGAVGFGVASGIIAGDLLLSSAHRLVSSCDAPGDVRLELVQVIDDAVVAAAAGEHADAWFGLGLEESDWSRVLRTIELKTARYSFQAPLRAASILAGADQDVRAALDEIGRRLGVVYQLRDDVLGVFGRPDVTGKSAQGDLREGKQTLLVAFARTTPDWARVSHLFGSPALTDAGAEQLRTVIRDCGALERVERTIDAESDAVRAIVAGAGFVHELDELLLDVLDRSAERAA
ncbi:polyprenyl synthetase family protein [Georgenia sp. Z1491]|uniref:polyprenyl synthetase family protein n=1 Tax=Georgenia sp. Z1491 TaxID=3416707 RepID=UPI003CF7866A